MSKIVIGATLQADTKQANDSVKSFKAQLRAANEELLKMQGQFGEFSNEAVLAAKKVADLKDSIGDARSLVDAMNPDAKFVAFGQSVQGVVGGFTALQGVMGLVGSESEEVNKALLKVQSALAISQGVDQILESVQGFKNLAAMVKNSTFFIKANEMANKAAAFSMKLFGVSAETTSTSFKVLKGAIAATGIGVLLLLVGEAVALFDQLASAAEKAAEAQKKAFEAADRGNQADEKGRLDFIAREEKREEARIKMRVGSEKELTASQIFWQKQRIQALEQNAAEEGISETRRNELLERVKEERVNLEVMTNNAITAENTKAKAEADKRAQEAKQRAEEERKRREAQIKAAQALNEELRKANDVTTAGGPKEGEYEKLEQEYQEKAAILKAGGQSLLELDEWYALSRKAIFDKYEQERLAQSLENIDKEKEARQAAMEAQAEFEREQIEQHLNAAIVVANDEALTLENRRLMIDAAETAILENTRLTEEQKNQMLQNFKEARLQIDQSEAEAKKGFYNDIAGAAGVLSEAIGRQTAVGKGLAVAQATMNTWQGATEVLRAKSVLPEPAATINKAINFAAVVATGYKAVKSIAKVNVPGGGGGGGSIPSTAPLTPQLQTTQTQLNQNSINAMGNQAIRAFVTETDVANNRERIERINRAARLG